MGKVIKGCNSFCFDCREVLSLQLGITAIQDENSKLPTPDSASWIIPIHTNLNFNANQLQS